MKEDHEGTRPFRKLEKESKEGKNTIRKISKEKLNKAKTY